MTCLQASWVGADAREVTATLDPDSRAYWIERAGGQEQVDGYNRRDRSKDTIHPPPEPRDPAHSLTLRPTPLSTAECIASFHSQFATLARELDAKGWDFFQSASRPGIKDLWLFAHHRQLSGTSRANARDVYEEGPLAGWTARMRDWFAAEMAGIEARDPK